MFVAGLRKDIALFAAVTLALALVVAAAEIEWKLIDPPFGSLRSGDSAQFHSSDWLITITIATSQAVDRYSSWRRYRHISVLMTFESHFNSSICQVYALATQSSSLPALKSKAVASAVQLCRVGRLGNIIPCARKPTQSTSKRLSRQF